MSNTAAQAGDITPQSADAILTLDQHADGVAVLSFDVPGVRQNTITADFGEAFEQRLQQIEQDSDISALVITSGKPGSFLAGADIGMFDRVHSAAEVEQMSRSLQAGFDRLSALPVPVVAAIDGACLGGGLELALACDVRVAANTPATALGVPEVMLGLLPAAGGTQRLPRLVGIQDGLDLLLTGRKLRPKQARSKGLVDAVVEPEALPAEALRLARTASKRPLTRSKPVITQLKTRLTDGVTGLSQVALEDNPAGRRVLFDQARKTARRKSKGHYPAIDKIIDVVALGYAQGAQAGLAAEAKAFGELALGDVSKALRHIYHSTEALKKATFGAGNAKPRETRQIGVLGAGLMGAGIATVSLDKAGLAVRLKDVSDDGLAHGMGHIRSVYAKRVKRGQMSRAEADRQVNSVTATTSYDGIGACDIVVEAVFEDLDLKQRMLADVEAAADARGNTDLIFATNTSSLPISDIAAKAKRPENVIGLHYFSPVEKMPLLEIIATEKTSKKTIATAVAFGKAQGKSVIVVKDAPGFYTTRALSPYLNEAARLLSEGAGVRDIDDALTDAGFPVGPMALLDEVGVDVGVKVGPILEAAFGERMGAPDASRQMIEAGYLGRKTGKGFYDYEADKVKGKRPVNAELERLLAAERSGATRPTREQIVERCTLAFANEAAHCLSEGIVSDAMQGDIGAVFGLGFLPFTGGPFCYIDSIGVDNFVTRLQTLVDAHGPRFEPAPLVRTMAAATTAADKRFYE